MGRLCRLTLRTGHYWCTALTNWVMAGARVQPVVLAFEDLHWADPTTLDVLRGIAERGALAPLLVVATTRPEFRPPWGMRSHHGTISLAPLDRAQVRDMVAELSARHALPRDVPQFLGCQPRRAFLGQRNVEERCEQSNILSRIELDLRQGALQLGDTPLGGAQPVRIMLGRLRRAKAHHAATSGE